MRYSRDPRPEGDSPNTSVVNVRIKGCLDKRQQRARASGVWRPLRALSHWKMILSAALINAQKSTGHLMDEIDCSQSGTTARNSMTRDVRSSQIRGMVPIKGHLLGMQRSSCSRKLLVHD